LMYMLDANGQELVRVSHVGIDSGHPAAPEKIRLDDPAPWPVAEALHISGPVVIANLEQKFGAELPRGRWDRPPSQAVVIPLQPALKTGRSAALVIGLNPFRLYNQDYESFLGLLANQIAGALASAQAYEEERQRAEALAELD